MITILSIDGGGIRGIIPATFLAHIEKLTGRPICSMFDYIAGTSTGGIITAMLTARGEGKNPKYSAAEVRALYEKLGKKVFDTSALRRVRTLRGIAAPKYSAAPLERLLREHLGDARLHSTLTNVLMPAYDMGSCAPWFFKTRHARRSTLLTQQSRGASEKDPLLWQAVRATTAAPTFFPPYSMHGRCLIDGGVFANNPMLCAYAEAQRAERGAPEILAVSVGTGENCQTTACGKIQKWGSVKWVLPLFGVFINSSSATVDYQMRALIGTALYKRYQIQIEKEHEAMDDASAENIARLNAYGRALIARNLESIEILCKILKAVPDKRTVFEKDGGEFT